ncbi:hypothetical protein M2444_004745 [Paenibacillus sp. PastF-3]|uniref:hypothetical protein n=1 Tax=Paenibacillus sp. PastF-3 TaxID=2940626 RepID=UPI001DE74183|nr:hypothetical protein [Paenibacillus sp. PastF-3]MBY3621120.1 hypothetical protein [Acinetobacter sp. CUI P1]MDH6372916.1 hypothetical protein [Paenibacillus sp. PastF-3]
MKKSGIRVFSLIVFIVFCFGAPAHAAPGDSQTGTVTNNQSINQSTGDSQGAIDITPVTSERFGKGMTKMGNDLSKFGERISYPLFLIALILGFVLLLLGIFSKKALAAGGISLVVAFTSLLFMGDMTKLMNIVNDITQNIRNYF